MHICLFIHVLCICFFVSVPAKRRKMDDVETTDDLLEDVLGHR